MSWELQGDLREANEEIAELKALLAKETARADAEARVVDWYADSDSWIAGHDGEGFGPWWTITECDRSPGDDLEFGGIGGLIARQRQKERGL